LAAPQATPHAALWARAVAECIARGECLGGVVFCADPALVCCVANKLSRLRAAVAATPQAAARARQSLGANLLAVETPGRTFFELRQILRTACGGPACCPDELRAALKELDGHAHR
jgi:ribose 5-phosphate isomerase RpiB